MSSEEVAVAKMTSNLQLIQIGFKYLLIIVQKWVKSGNMFLFRLTVF